MSRRLLNIVAEECGYYTVESADQSADGTQ
jgi:hypothetical protein